MVEEREGAGDAELVRRTRAGDRRAFGSLVDRYLRPAYGVALSVVKRHADAEDVAQEAFAVALERIDELRHPERFGGWFFSIVRTRALNLVRSRGYREGEEIPHGASTDAPGPDRDAERSELRERLLEALDELPEERREVVFLHDLEGWKHREIAERMGLPVGTVRSHLHYARRALRELLSDLDPGTGAG